MRVVAFVPSYAPLTMVGAWIATHQWLRALTQVGHDVEVMIHQTYDVRAGVDARIAPYTLDGIRVAPRGRDYADVFHSADVIVSHVGDNNFAHKWAVHQGVPSVRLAHSVPSTDVHDRLEGASLLVANSAWTAERIGWDGPTVVAHPITWPGDYATSTGSAVSIVNLSADKGADTFWKLAARMPDVEFLACRGGWGDQVEPDPIPSNVNVVGPVTDVRDVYAQTRILLVPSISESWGLVAVEAMCSGIPVVAHPSPGLREAAGGAAFWVDRDDVDGWERTIRRLLAPSAWQVASKVAMARVAQLDPAEAADTFVAAVESVLARQRLLA